ncbi:MAG TPA: MFS transporter [Phenylobacterium sp.]
MAHVSATADRDIEDPGASAEGGRLPRSGVAWALFEGARNPYIMLVSIYLFTPYLAQVVIGDAVKGQEMISRANMLASLVTMLTAPFLGAAIDQIGRRKGLLAGLICLMAPMVFALWWVKPDQTGIGVLGALVITATYNVLYPYTEVLHNSLLVRNAGLSKAHQASALALVTAQTVTLATMLLMFWGFALPGTVDWSFIPKAPLFGVDASQHEAERMVGPICAFLLVVGSAPFFLFARDAEPTGTPLTRAFADGARELWGIVRTARSNRDALVFLIARMFYFDGLNAVTLFSGLYVSGTMGWNALQMLIFGILGATFAAFGGALGGVLDARLGPKRAVQIEIAMNVLAIAGFLGTSKTQILFMPYDPATPHLWNGPFLTTAPDIVMLGLALLVCVFATANWASSRTLMTRLSPPDQAGAFFGVFALSGTATLWLGSLMVNLGTNIFHSLSGGFGAIVILLAIGLVGLAFVRGGNKLSPAVASS